MLRSVVIAFDPGRNIGYARVSDDGRLLEHGIVDLARVDGVAIPAGVRVVVGDGTGSRALQARLRARGTSFEVHDERGTSLEGRRLYLREHPPRGLGRLLPPGMRSAPGPIDDYAAYALALRVLAGATPRAPR